MARPISKGFPYFTLDSDIFYADRNIKAVMGRYGTDALILYIYILSEIYRQEGYFAVYDDLFAEYAASQLNINCGQVENMLAFLLKRNLFDERLFKEESVITSHGVQLRFQEMSKMRGKKNEIEINPKLWLLSKNETQDYINFSENNAENSSKISSYSENNHSFSRNNDAKEKESKVNKSKVKESINEAADGSKHPYGEMENVLLTDKELAKLKEKFPDDYLERIDRLSLGISTMGYNYKSHYAAIVRWAKEDGGKASAVSERECETHSSKPKSSFHNFDQRKIDFDEIEKEYFESVKQSEIL